ncbi:MAG TPA: hypothetical protein VGE67_20320, partial [Haloferula sp.]
SGFGTVANNSHGSHWLTQAMTYTLAAVLRHSADSPVIPPGRRRARLYRFDFSKLPRATRWDGGDSFG